MPVQRLNHAVLYVRDVERSVAFYREALGFEPVMEMPGAAFLQAASSSNDHDLGLFQIGAQAGPSPAGRTAVGLYHLAWEVDTLDELERVAAKLSELGALVGASDHATTKALYAHDPDGLEFEVSWLVSSRHDRRRAALRQDPRPAARPGRRQGTVRRTHARRRRSVDPGLT
ncbi:VOC family protein [Nonomuraea ferruginea]